MDFIKSKVLGILTPLQSPGWWKSNSVRIPVFGETKLPIHLMRPRLEGDLLFGDIDALIQEFLSLTIEHRNLLSMEVYQHCQQFFEITGFDEDAIEMLRRVSNPEKWHLDSIRLGELLHLRDVNAIWEFTSVRDIYIENDDKGAFQVATHLHCDWEEEHGLDIIFKSGWDTPSIEIGE
jgi:hypothetical protein